MNPILFFFAAEAAHVEHATDAKMIAVKAFERGYYPIRGRAAERGPDAMNAGKYTPDVLQSALEASMFGWDVPAARPAREWVEAEEKRRAAEADAAYPTVDEQENEFGSKGTGNSL